MVQEEWDVQSAFISSRFRDQTQQDDQLEEERLALFQAGLCKGILEGM